VSERRRPRESSRLSEGLLGVRGSSRVPGGLHWGLRVFTGSLGARWALQDPLVSEGLYGSLLGLHGVSVGPPQNLWESGGLRRISGCLHRISGGFTAVIGSPGYPHDLFWSLHMGIQGLCNFDK